MDDPCVAYKRTGMHRKCLIIAAFAPVEGGSQKCREEPESTCGCARLLATYMARRWCSTGVTEELQL